MAPSSATLILVGWLTVVFLIATGASLLITPLVIKAAGALRLYDAPDGVRRLHASPVPRLGGIAVYLAASVVALGVFFLGTAVFVPGHELTPGLFAMQIKARQEMSRSERAALRAEETLLSQVARVVRHAGIALTAIGLGGFLLLQLLALPPLLQWLRRQAAGTYDPAPF